MRVIRGDRWWKTHYLFDIFDAFAFVAAVGWLLVAGIGWSPALAPFAVVPFAMVPFWGLTVEKAERDRKFSRRFQRTWIVPSLVIANALIWDGLYLGGGQVHWLPSLGLAILFSALLVRMCAAIVWGLILAIGQHHKPRKPAKVKGPAYDLLD